MVDTKTAYLKPRLDRANMEFALNPTARVGVKFHALVSLSLTHAQMPRLRFPPGNAALGASPRETLKARYMSRNIL